MHHARIIVLTTLLMVCGGVSAQQLHVVPRLSLGLQQVTFEQPNIYKFESDISGTTAVDAILRYSLSEKFALDLGIGMHRAYYGEKTGIGSINYAPAYLGIRYGNELYIESHVGYNIPTATTGLAYIYDLSYSFGVGFFGDGISLGASLDFNTIALGYRPGYIPDGYLPANGGYALSLYLEYAIPLSK